MSLKFKTCDNFPALFYASMNNIFGLFLKGYLHIICDSVYLLVWRLSYVHRSEAQMGEPDLSQMLFLP